MADGSVRLRIKTDERIGKGLGTEGLEVLETLADADEVDRKRPFAAHCRDGREDAALGCSVELRDDETRQMGKRVEGLDLGERVLAVRSVHDENDFVRCTFHGLFLGTADPAELLHEVGLRGKPSGRIGDDDVKMTGTSCGHGIEDDGCGIAPRLGDHVDAIAFAPDGKLFASRCTEGVACGKKDAPAFIGEVAGKLADGRGLAGAVDAAHHDDAGRGLRDVERSFCRREDLHEFIAQCTANVVLRLQSLPLNVTAQALYDVRRGLDAHVCGDQRGLELLKEVLVDDAAREDADDVVPRARETFLQACTKILKETKTHTSKRPMNIPKKERGRSNSLSLTSPARARAGSVRIVGGRWRRTPLSVRDQEGLRPTPERVRETIYDWLGHLLGSFDGRAALDLFAGSGALGLEAASRGFSRVDLVERDRRQAAEISTVVGRLSAGEAVHVNAEDAFAFLDRTPELYDLVLIDPPFARELQDRAVLAALARLKENGIIYVERSGERSPDDLLERAGLVRLRAGSAGQVSYELLARTSGALAPLAREERMTRREARLEAARLRRAARTGGEES